MSTKDGGISGGKPSIIRFESDQVTPLDTAGPSRIGNTSGKRKTPWRLRRNTPYTRIPRTRNLRNTVTIRNTTRTTRLITTDGTEPTNAPPPHFEKAVIGKTWRVYKMSPMYRFGYEDASLKMYGRLLATYIQAELKKGFGLLIKNDDYANLAKFEICNDVKDNEDEPDAITITLSRKGENGGQPKVVLIAILCCVGADTDYVRSIGDGFTHLPIMLVKGAVALTRHLSAFMETTFDCCISNATISPLWLTWMLAMWSGYVPEKGPQKRVELVYSIPDTVKELSSVTLSIDSAQCQQLWKEIHPDESKEFAETEVVDFVKSLEYHFYHHFRINLEALALSRIGTATAFVGNEGKVKIFSPKHIKQVLGHLTEVVLGQRFLL